MIFTSALFIFWFLPLTIVIYYALNRKRNLQNIFLLLASLLFYAWGEPIFVFVMILSIVFNYFMGIVVTNHRNSESRKKLFLAITIIFNVAFLFYFKYIGFLLTEANHFFDGRFVIPVVSLPIGISFFTFQAISYVIDVYRGNGEAQRNPLNVGLYISLFPQLIAGPIVRYQTVAEQIKERKETYSDFVEGVKRFAIGFIKKVFIANNVAIVADAAFNQPQDELSVSMAWLGALAYTFQIFFDFSGYSDMAIGLGRMFGFKFLENFNYPYISKSVSEFWRRWHISLGEWFRDYVYFPMGGSKVNSTLRLLFNLFVVWLLTGIWHGANWTFIVWGLFYFVLIAVEKITKFEKRFKDYNSIKHLYVILLTLFGWVLFRSPNISTAFAYMGTMLNINSNPIVNLEVLFYLKEYGFYFIIALIFSIPVWPMLQEKIKNRKQIQYITYGCVCLLFLLSLSFTVKNAYNPFIYFNF